MLKNENTEFEEETVVKVKSKTNKMPLIAVGTALVAIGLGGFSLWSSQNTVSREDFESYQQSAGQSVMSVNVANRAFKSDIEGLQSAIQTLRQELEASKQELAASKLEMSEKLTAQENELNMKISSLQELMKRAPKKTAAPVAKAKFAPAPVKSKPLKPMKK